MSGILAQGATGSNIPSSHVIIAVRDEEKSPTGNLDTSKSGCRKCVDLTRKGEPKALAAPSLLVGLAGAAYFFYLNNMLASGLFIGVAVCSVLICVRSNSWITQRELADVQERLAKNVANLAKENGILDAANKKQTSSIEKLEEQIKGFSNAVNPLSAKLEKVGKDLLESNAKGKLLSDEIETLRLALTRVQADLKNESGTVDRLNIVNGETAERIKGLEAERKVIDLQLNDIKTEMQRLVQENNSISDKLSASEALVKMSKDELRQSVKSEGDLLNSQTRALRLLTLKEQEVSKQLAELGEQLSKRQEEFNKLVSSHKELERLIKDPSIMQLFSEWLSSQLK